MTQTRLIINIALLAIVMATGGCGIRQTHLSEGDLLPDLTLETIDGRSQNLSQYRGRRMILNIWATWCAPCREEMPSLARLAKQLDPNEAIVVTLSVDNDPHLVKEFLIKYQLDLKVLMIPDGQNVEALLDVETYPLTFIVSPQGIIEERVEGVRSWDLYLQQQHPT